MRRPRRYRCFWWSWGMSEFETRELDSFIADGSVLLGRGDIISKEDIEAHPGPYRSILPLPKVMANSANMESLCSTKN